LAFLEPASFESRKTKALAVIHPNYRLDKIIFIKIYSHRVTLGTHLSDEPYFMGGKTRSSETAQLLSKKWKLGAKSATQKIIKA